jgi:hypothetical protein
MAIPDESNDAAHGRKRILPHSWLDVLYQDKELVDHDSGYRIPQTVRTPNGLGGRTESLLVGLDNGNYELKYTLLHRKSGRFVHGSVVTAVQRARQLSAGQREGRTWVVSDVADSGSEHSEQGTRTIVTGETALMGGASLSVGSTSVRLSDARHVDMLMAVLVQGLIEAGYEQGEYPIALGFGIPNSEVRPMPGNPNRNDVVPETKEALRSLRRKVFDIETEDPDGRVLKYRIYVVNMVPVAQTLGGASTWGMSLAGQDLTGSIKKVTAFDIGGGDLQYMEFSLPHWTASGNRLGDGTVLLARGLMEQFRQSSDFSRLTPSMAELQRALIHQRIMLGGEEVPIPQMVRNVMDTDGAELLSRIQPFLADTSQFVLGLGGGLRLMGGQIIERAIAAGRAPESYLLVPDELAQYVNVVGVYANALYVFEG